MTIRVSIVDMPADDVVRAVAARWSIEEWGAQFPGDTVETYLGLYDDADLDPNSLPMVLAAMVDDEIVGTASLVVDDELPAAIEPGPWVAAVFVSPSHRRAGVGRLLVQEATARAARLGHHHVYLYTHDSQDWYQRMGWRDVRAAHLHGLPVTVMTISTASEAH